jgi:hypothetical protein
MPRTVDRSIAKMVAYKRISTGTIMLLAGVGMIVAAVLHGTPPTPGLALALLIFFGGGGWTLRDGLRTRRDLRESAQSAQPAPSAPSAPAETSRSSQ